MVSLFGNRLLASFSIFGMLTPVNSLFYLEKKSSRNCQSWLTSIWSGVSSMSWWGIMGMAFMRVLRGFYCEWAMMYLVRFEVSSDHKQQSWFDCLLCWVCYLPAIDGWIVVAVPCAVVWVRYDGYYATLTNNLHHSLYIQSYTQVHSTLVDHLVLMEMKL